MHLESGQKIHLGDVAFDFVPDGSARKNDERAKTEKSDGESEAKHHEEAENNPVVLGLTLMGTGLIVLGFVVMLGIDAIKAIAERGQAFIVGGGALILAGIITLGSILFATGRVKIPKLVLRFEDRDDEDDEDDEEDDDSDENSDDDDEDSDEDGEEDSDDEEEELGKGPKEDDEEEKESRKD